MQPALTPCAVPPAAAAAAAARHQIGTRTFSRPADDGSSGGSGDAAPATHYFALPLLDLANHDNACPHASAFAPCAADAGRECLVFTAGADVAAGNPVCFHYGHLLPDRALLEYGFLPMQHDAHDAAQLFGVDRHDADAAGAPLPKMAEAPQPFAGGMGGWSAVARSLGRTRTHCTALCRCSR